MRASRRVLTLTATADRVSKLLLPGKGPLPSPGSSRPSKQRLGALTSALLTLNALDARLLPKAPALLLSQPKASPKAKVKAPLDHGMPSKKAIRNAVARHKGEIRLCYQRTLLHHATPPQGRLLLRWRIDEKGKAQGIRAIRDAMAAPQLTRCIIKHLRSWSFPTCRGNTCEVIYPFEFFSHS
ncbi:MAG: AgmX/PglI C-terminal domain-containing protein [Deltaproteobacteria bacterium]|nr:AgmX/PglI C-terminal domain-containing protein [Deltaproteobacteria bacterium]